MQNIEVVAAAMFNQRGEVLVAQRPIGKALAGRWEFPGGKMHGGESQSAALRRELAEELGVELKAHRHVLSTTHRYPDRQVTLHFHLAEQFDGEARSLDQQALRWLPVDALGGVDILEADQEFVAALQTLPRPAPLVVGQVPRGAEVSMASTATDQQRFTGEHFAVRNPRTGLVDFELLAPSTAEVQQAAQRLRRAQRAWRDSGLPVRIATLRRLRDALAARQQDIVAALATDCGRHAIASSECASVLAAIERWCALVPTLAQEEEGRASGNPNLTWRSQFVPFGLVGVISPWNFPLALTLIDVVPALLAGCAVLVKPSEVTPRFAVPLRAAIDAVPELAAVLCVAPGGRETGEALVAAVDIVCFTGSVRTGRLVAENAARHFVPAFLELGGNDPLIVTATADIERATDIALRSTCLATGQACQSIERVYVDRRMYDAFVALLVRKAEKITLNWPDLRSGIVGPFIFAPQAQQVAAQIADAKAKGARVLTGGQIEDHGGKWLRPTVVVDVTHDMALMSEETFGPVIPVMPFDTIEQAIALANEGVFGLSAGVVAGTLAEAEAVGRQIDAGGISLNDGSLTAVMHEAEKNSFKMSGMGGSRMGASGYTRFFRRKVLIRQTGAPVTLDMIAEDHVRG